MKTTPFKIFLAIALPAIGFFASWSLAKQRPPIATAKIQTAPHPKRVAADDAKASSEGILAAVALLPEWNLIGWEAQIRQLTADELRSFISSEKGKIGAERLIVAVRRLGELDGLKAVEFVAALGDLPEGPNKYTLRDTVLTGWLAADPKGALLTAAADENLVAQLPEFVANLARQQPQLAIELVELPELANSKYRPQIIANLARHIGMGPSEEAFRWFDSLPENDRANIVPSFFGQQARVDPAAAAVRIAKLPAGQARGPALDVAANWAVSDPQAAIAWSQALPQGDLAWDTQRTALIQWAHADAEATWNYLNGLNEKDRRALLDEPLDQTASRAIHTQRNERLWVQERTLGAELLDGMPTELSTELISALRNSSNSQIRRRAEVTALVALAATDPAAAIAQSADLPEATTTTRTGGVRDFPLSPLIDAAIARDPAEGFDLALTFPQQHRDDAISYSIRAWGDRDPAAAREHISRMEPGGERDSAYEGYAEKLVSEDPAAAAQDFGDYLRSSGDEAPGEGMVLQVTDSVISGWFEQDPTAVANWTASLENPQARKHALEVMMSKWKAFGDSDSAIARLRESGFSAEELESLSP